MSLKPTGCSTDGENTLQDDVGYSSTNFGPTGGWVSKQNVTVAWCAWLFISIHPPHLLEIKQLYGYSGVAVCTLGHVRRHCCYGSKRIHENVKPPSTNLGLMNAMGWFVLARYMHGFSDHICNITALITRTVVMLLYYKSTNNSWLSFHLFALKAMCVRSCTHRKTLLCFV